MRDLCGVQAQLLSAAELALSARLSGLTQRHVRDALWRDRSIARAWTVRGTIHLVPADELSLWIAAVGADRYWESPTWLARHGLTAREAGRIFATVVDALDGRALTRAEITEQVVRRHGERIRPKIGSMWGELLGPLTHMGKLCFGPAAGSKVTFVRADQWISGWRTVDPDVAWRTLVARFLGTYGPTTVEGVTRWFGIEPAAAKERLAELGATQVDVEGQACWALRGDAPRGPASKRTVVRLLPQYDAYVMGSHPRDRLISDRTRLRIKTFKRGRWEGAAGVPALLVDGRLAGVWGRELRRKRVSIEIEPTERLTAAQRRLLRTEAERVGQFLGFPADLRVAA